MGLPICRKNLRTPENNDISLKERLDIPPELLHALMSGLPHDVPVVLAKLAGRNSETAHNRYCCGVDFTPWLGALPLFLAATPLPPCGSRPCPCASSSQALQPLCFGGAVLADAQLA